MKLVDVTLRDGGFVCDFDWGLDVARTHISTMCSLKTHVIEIAYWGQTAKSNNAFYNMDKYILNELSDAFSKSTKCAVMIDYHYCSKQMNSYPIVGETRLDLLRLTSRKSDFLEALEFANKLKIETGLEISFQIINATNYSKSELDEVVHTLVDSSVDIVAFADSHGNMNLMSDYHKYSDAVNTIQNAGKNVGFHLHNHTGRAQSNYLFLKMKKIDFIDASVNGLGKGLGNLKYDEIIRNEEFPELLEYMIDAPNLAMRRSNIDCFRMTTARCNVTDNYAKDGKMYNLNQRMFFDFASRLRGNDRDCYSEGLLKNFLGQ